MEQTSAYQWHVKSTQQIHEEFSNLLIKESDSRPESDPNIQQTEDYLKKFGSSAHKPSFSENKIFSVPGGSNDKGLVVQKVHGPRENGLFLKVFNELQTLRTDPVLSLDTKHYWRGSTKRLRASDVNNQARLLWPNANIPTTMRNQCMTHRGQRFKVEDIDTGTSYMLTLKQWSSGSYVFTTNWSNDFVARRSLKVNDVIGFLLDSSSSKFYFSVLSQS